VTLNLAETSVVMSRPSVPHGANLIYLFPVTSFIASELVDDIMSFLMYQSEARKCKEDMDKKCGKLNNNWTMLMNRLHGRAIAKVHLFQLMNV